MTTLISNRENNALSQSRAEAATTPAPVFTTYRIRHTLVSRFAFLIICLAIVLSALAYGTVHSWALAIFHLGAVVLLLLWMLDSWQLGSLRISLNFLQLPILAVFALGLIQLLPLRQPDNPGTPAIPLVRSLSFDSYATRLILLEVFGLLIYFAATLVFIDTPKRLRLLVRTIIIFGFLLAIFGLTQSFTSPTRLYWLREMPQSMGFGPFINRHHFAGYMELTIALPLGLIFSGSVPREKKFLYIFAAALMAIGLIMTNSRGGIISLSAEILFLVSLMGIGRRHKKKRKERQPRIKSAALKAGLALAMVIGLFGGVVLLGGEDVLSRLVGTVNTDDPTTGRAHFWSVTVDIIKNHPIIGTGLGAFPVVYTGYDSRNGLYRLEQAHNDYLQVLSDGGIVGAVIGVIFLVSLFRMGFARRESRDDFRSGVATGALAGCFAVLVHSFFDFTLHTTANALLFLTLAALATMNGRVEEVHSRRKKKSRSRFLSKDEDLPPSSTAEITPSESARASA